MPRFPRSETDVIQLSDDMLTGFKKKPEYFPNADRKGMEALRNEYNRRKSIQMDIFEQYKKATDEKDEVLRELIAKMKLELKQAEVDAQNDPGRLQAISWGWSQPAEELQVPGAPRSLECSKGGAGEVLLDWKPPSRGAGGKVQVYEVERRIKAKREDWTLVATSLDLETALRDQPTGVEMEYRVAAKNKRGTSEPSAPALISL